MSPFSILNQVVFWSLKNILDIKALSDTMCFRQCIVHLNTKKAYWSMTLENSLYT